jgi:hypothetical protein
MGGADAPCDSLRSRFVAFGQIVFLVSQFVPEEYKLLPHTECAVPPPDACELMQLV